MQFFYFFNFSIYYLFVFFAHLFIAYPLTVDFLSCVESKQDVPGTETVRNRGLYGLFVRCTVEKHGFGGASRKAGET